MLYLNVVALLICCSSLGKVQVVVRDNFPLRTDSELKLPPLQNPYDWWIKSELYS